MNRRYLPQKIILLVLFLSSCQTCGNMIYTINERPYVHITFHNRYRSTIVEDFIDHELYKLSAVPDSIKQHFISMPNYNEYSRLVYFSKYPNEAYLIGFEVSPCWIMDVYNTRISNEIISDKKLLNNQEQKRIHDIFHEELFDKISLYIKRNNIADSIAFKK